MNNKVLIAIIVILVVIIVGGAYYFLTQNKGSETEGVNQSPVGTSTNAEQATQPPAPEAASPEEPLSEQPNKAKFNEYLTGAYLAKLSEGQEFNPIANPPAKTKVFIATDRFCTSLDLKKDIATGTIATAVYDVLNKEYAAPKAVFPMAMKRGNTMGCESLVYSTGKYELKVYFDDVLAVVLPFEVK